MIKGIAHLAFRVTDMDDAVRFYETVFGFKKIFTLDDEQGHPWLVYLKVADRQFIELFHAEKPLRLQPEITAYQHLCIEVTDMDAFTRHLDDLGMTPDQPVIRGLDHNLQCWIKDPDGNPIEIMAYGPDALQLRYQ
ncbi:MAG: VOC family protein [Acholeplasmataceae bacterium]|nr:MAG: VOC family protein [Acholeplasmataceae bacterium]